jgi:hypothetical protein
LSAYAVHDALSVAAIAQAIIFFCSILVFLIHMGCIQQPVTSAAVWRIHCAAVM